MQSSIRLILKKEILSLRRNRAFSTLCLSLWLFLAFAILMGSVGYVRENKKVSEANSLFRQQWEKQRGNPHDVSHFGTSVFYPVNLLAAFDPGLNNYFGTSYQIEAHKQNEVDFSNAEHNPSALRFGVFSTSFVLQVILPLLLLFTTCSCVTDEREAGTMKMLIAQGVGSHQIVWGKVLANYFIAVVIVLPVFVLLWLCLLFDWSNPLALKLLLSSCGYLLYYLIIVILGVTVSLLSDTTQNALVLGFGIWLLFTIFLPKVFTGMADQYYQPMSRATFKNAVEQGFLRGLDGKDLFYRRVERDLKRILKQYHADSTSQLPVDAQAIIMQDNEDYRNMVFDHYHRQIDHAFEKQQSFLSVSGIIDPFIALKRISMATAGTDFYHHVEFFNQARAYRNSFIRTLNLEQAKHPVKANASYQAPSSFFKSIPDFNYRYLDIKTLLQLQWMAIFALSCWPGMLALLLQLLAKRAIL